MNTSEMLQKIMQASYTVDHVIPEHKASFRDVLMKMTERVDWNMEGYSDPEKQRDLSTRFCWGHNHDFGEFSYAGRMGNRHISILAEFIDRFGLPQDLAGKRVLDVGVWTGGTCLLLAALGAEVVALEEVKKYADAVNYLAAAFGLSNIRCEPISVYDFNEQDTFDFVIYSGVIYHVTDPVLSLRILFNSLKDGGRIFLETYSINTAPDSPPLAVIQGPSITGEGNREDLTRGGWNYYIPSDKGLYLWMETAGFENIDMGNVNHNNRLKCAGTRVQHKDMLRAGLSRPSVR
jgi:2-polyprenyl-3-methyl-5-hydroxy-6-metoxy-1,4-benzoquinol methylase